MEIDRIFFKIRINLNTVSLDLYSKVHRLTCIIEILWSNIGIILHFFFFFLSNFAFFLLYEVISSQYFPDFRLDTEISFFIGQNFNTIYNNEGHAPIFFTT